ncbi:sigma-70 family RNA polymerase sigma factor [bacterium]|nr:sigma-70 family RNA polymerase sigma factor [bacterium]
MSEQKLIDKALNGKRYAQNELYKIYYPYVYTIALRYSSSAEESQEITHDAFIKAFGKLDKYNQSQPFKPWLRRITINAAIDYYRKYQSVPKTLEIIDYDASVDNEILEKFDAEQILELISRLSPAYRVVFSLFVIEGYSHQEIAEMLEISVGASKSNLSKAKANLRELATNELGITKKMAHEQ